MDELGQRTRAQAQNLSGSKTALLAANREIHSFKASSGKFSRDQSTINLVYAALWQRRWQKQWE